jgi:hypothetical protein
MDKFTINISGVSHTINPKEKRDIGGVCFVGNGYGVLNSSDGSSWNDINMQNFANLLTKNQELEEKIDSIGTFEDFSTKFEAVVNG